MTTSSQNTQQQQTQSQNTQTNPWAPTEGLLGSIIGQLGGFNPSVTANQSGAANNLQSAANGIPNMGPAVTNLSGGLLSNIPNLNANAQQNFGNLSSSLSPLTNPNNLNPMNTPGLSTALAFMNNQIGNQVNGEFAGAGRDLSPANSGSLAYNLAGAEAPLVMGQYNQNVNNLENAANSIFSAGSTTNNNILGNAAAGTAAAGAIPGLSVAGPLASLEAANTGYNLPLSNLSGNEGLILPIAGLGGQSSGTGTSNGTSTTQSTASPFASLLGMFNGQYSPFSNMTNAAGGILGGLGAFL